jgi:hypothetical protein
VIHLYTLSSTAPTLAVAGVDGEPVEVVAAGRLYATVSHHPAAPTASADAAVAHAAVVAAVADEVGALPVRYGTHHRDLSALRTSLAGDEPALLAQLDRVGDAVEFMVGLAEAPSPLPAPIPSRGEASSGRAYLEGRLAAQRERDRHRRVAIDRIVTATAPVAALALESVDVDGRRGPERCFLVPRTGAPGFADAARAALRSEPTLSLGGPWPPYTFVRPAEAP